MPTDGFGPDGSRQVLDLYQELFALVAGEDAPAPRSPDDLPPAPQGYQIVKELGRGGMGVVYEAIDLALGRTVALKMILAGAHAGPTSRARFRAEAEAVAGLQHHNIVQIYEVGEHGRQPFLALEHVAGGSLADRLDGTPMRADEAAALVERLARAVQFAHDRGIVHRDLKPANVLLTDDGTPKITDFGLAKRLADGDSPTATVAVLGTPSYMAPEQARGDSRAAGTAADVYGLGAILYALLTGLPPFQADTPLATQRRVVDDEPVSPHRLRRKLPRDLVTVCLKCLRKRPEQRYASAAAFADDLHRFRVGEPIIARPVGRVERACKWAKRRPTAAALVAVLVLVFVGSLVGAVMFGESQRRRAREAEALRAEAERANYFLNVRLADAEWTAGRVDRAAEYLKLCRVDVPDWEWNYLWRKCNAERDALRAHDRLDSFALSPDGRRLMTVSSGLISAWELPSKRLLFRQEVETGRVVFTPDGRRFACLRAGQVVALFDTETGRELWTWDALTPLAALMFQPVTGRLTAIRDNGSVWFWDPESKARVEPWAIEAETIRCAAFSPDGRLLAVGLKPAVGKNEVVQVWDVAGRRCLGTVEHDRRVSCVVFGPDGNLVASGTFADEREARPHKIKVWEAATGRALPHFRGQHATSIDSLVFDPGGRWLASLGDRCIRLWPLDPAEADRDPGPVRTIRGVGDFRQFQFSPDGREILTAGRDGTVRFWDAEKGQDPLTLREPGAGDVFAFDYCLDGQAIAQIGAAGKVVVHGARGGERRWLREAHSPGDGFKLAASRDGRYLASGGFDGALCVFDAGTGDLLHRFAVDPARGRVRAMAFPPEEGLVVFGHFHGGTKQAKLVLGDFRTGATEELWDHASEIEGLAFDPAGGLLVAAGDAGEGSPGLRLWDWKSRQPAAVSLEGVELGFMCVAFSPDGRQLAASHDRWIYLWNLASGRLERRWLAHTAHLTSLAFHPSGRRLASGSKDRTVRVWEPSTGREVLELFDHSGGVDRVAFSPDGHQLTSSGWDKMVIVRDATPP